MQATRAPACSFRAVEQISEGPYLSSPMRPPGTVAHSSVRKRYDATNPAIGESRKLPSCGRWSYQKLCWEGTGLPPNRSLVDVSMGPTRPRGVSLSSDVRKGPADSEQRRRLQGRRPYTRLVCDSDLPRRWDATEAEVRRGTRRDDRIRCRRTFRVKDAGDSLRNGGHLYPLVIRCATG